MENNGVAIGVNKHDMSKNKVKRLSKVYRILLQHKESREGKRK